ncbi:hypothetical protein A3850_009800 [Lewinella sp. 4G2]|nr:hypothetical protein A3850_009800 [Lewinella sp. 4G2]
MLVLLLGFVGTSCDDQLDINTDPLAATAVDANLLFPEVLLNFSNNREAELDGRLGTVLQYNEAIFGVIGDYARAERSNVNMMNNTWGAMYGNAVKNINLLEATAREAEPGTQNNILAQGLIMKSLIFWQATMLWEDIPFRQAADFVTALPEYERQEDVLRGIVSDLDEAANLIDEESAKMTNGDLVYDGDMDLWLRAANSLKLKILLQIANVDEASVRDQIRATVNSPLLETEDQNAQLEYLDMAGAFNPFWSILNNFAGGVNPTWYTAGEVCFDLLEDLDDPRLGVYYSESAADSTQGTGNFGVRSPAGVFRSEGGTAAIVSLTVIRADRPDTYITAAETQLYKAEAILRGLADGSAEDAFAAGIRASMDEFDTTAEAIEEDAVTAYINSLDLDLEGIHEQLYLANFLRIPAAWAEWRRTKVPNLSTPNGSNADGVVRRFFYPPDERAANPNVPETLDANLDSPMWYEGN